MSFSAEAAVPALTVFLQGLLSFFSPCVLPLLPLYFGYLAGQERSAAGTAGSGTAGSGSMTPDAAGAQEPSQAPGTDVYAAARARRGRARLLFRTFCFVCGIAASFFLLGLGMTAVGRFFSGHRRLLAQIGGILVLLFGLYQLGLFGSSPVLERERRLPFSAGRAAASAPAAFLLGFLFSFAWTPCVGPALSSVLLMAASAQSRALGFALIGVYTLGFCLPFLVVGLFTDTLLSLLKKHRGIVRYTKIAGGILMILMGLLMITGTMDSVSGYLSRLGGPGSTAATAEAPSEAPAETQTETQAETQTETQTGTWTETSAETPSEAETSGTSAAAEGETVSGEELPDAVGFELTDQYGQTHTLEEYRGKVIFLNFWATWCPPCRAEMPDIQTLYESYQEQEDPSVVILGVASPSAGGEEDEEGIRAFLTENGYTYPVLMDTGGQLMSAYYVSAIPTTYMITADGKIFGYVTGSIPLEFMQSIIDQTLRGVRE